MIRDLSEMPALVHFLLGDVETEVVEYKEAKRNFDFEKLGKYFQRLATKRIFAAWSADGFYSG